MPTFAQFGLIEPLLRALDELAMGAPTPVQVQSLPALLARRDLLALAPTGTGKTAAFALPLLQLLAAGAAENEPRALILAPTRELVVQIRDHIDALGKHLSIRSYALYGGVELGPQIRALGQGVDLLVATPGRLLHLLRAGHLALNGVQVLVLDEADRLLDEGFEAEIQAILGLLPATGQRLLLSATLPPALTRLADGLLTDPVVVRITAEVGPAGPIQDRVAFVRSSDKRALVLHLLQDPTVARSLVFVRTRDGADRLCAFLREQDLAVDVLHADRSQADRAAALLAFREGGLAALVATDLASRGIDVEGVDRVISLDLPRSAEDHIHRVGRTGRAGRPGLALSLCDETDGGRLRDLERGLNAPLVPDLSLPYTHLDAIPDPRATAAGKGVGSGSRRRKKARRG